MDQTFHDELAEIVQAVAIYSPMQYSFRGGPPVQVPPQEAAAQPVPGQVPYGQPPPPPLVQALQNTFYQECYTRRSGAPTPPAHADPTFAGRLSQANTTRERWDPGWTIYDIKPGAQIFVQKGERHRSAMPGEYATSSGPGMGMQPGHTVSLHVVRESFQMQPGFYFAFSDTLSDQFDDFSMVRFYFNSTGEGAPSLLGYLSEVLNGYLVPYRYKCLNDPAYYDRADAAVLYVARRYFRIVARLIEEMPEGVATGLKPPQPLFSKPLRPGIGMADDPATGESFGMHRCRLVAEALFEAWQQGQHTPEARLEAVRRHFTRNGLDLDRPYLNPAAADIYARSETEPLAV